MTDEALRLLLDRINRGAGTDARNVAFQPSLVAGESCASLRRAWDWLKIEARPRPPVHHDQGSRSRHVGVEPPILRNSWFLSRLSPYTGRAARFGFSLESRLQTRRDA